MTWHRRLGHLNSRDLTKMKNGAAEGLICKGEIEMDKYNCISCNEGKQARSSFSDKGTRAEGLLECRRMWPNGG